MKTKTNKLISLLMCLCLLVGMLPISAVTAFAEDEPATSGTCGESVTWTYDKENYTLTISGTGDMANYTSSSPAPWDSWKSDSTYPIKTVVIESGVTSIGKYAFYKCNMITSVAIPDSVISIGNAAFKDCTSLTSVTIPKNVTNINPQVFDSCSKMTTINVDEANENYSSIDGVLFSKDKKTLHTYPGGKTETTYTIPDGVTNINTRAFKACKMIKEINIPSSVNSIGGWAFMECHKLETINIPEGVSYIEGQTFAYCYGLKKITIPASITKINYLAFFSSDLKTIEFLGAQPTIDETAFSGVTATVIYPAEQTYDTTQNYGGTLTWVSVGDDHSQRVKMSGQEPTCTADGWKDYHKCKYCTKLFDAENNEITDLEAWKAGAGKIDATGHTVVTDSVVPATCTANGLTEGSHCSTCGQIFVAQQVVPATGHTIVTDSAVPATCTANGLTEGSHCSTCGQIFVAQQVIPAIAHTVVTDSAVTATCTANGLTEGSHCSTCGQVITAQQVVPATGHNFGNNQLNCSACGVTNPNYVAPQTTTKKPTAPSGAKKVDGVFVNSKYKKPTISKLSKGKKQIKVSWKKVSSVSGYQVQYSTSKKFTKKTTKSVTIKGNKSKSPSKTIKSLKAKKTYYVRVRTYKNVKFNGKTVKVYSGWSKVKSVKTK